MNYKKLPTREELLNLFDYDKNKGVLFWKNSKSYKAKKGKEAGCTARYIVVRINNKLYPAHRVIYKIALGEFDETKEIDHIDQNKHNNRIQNLRVVDRHTNSMNRPKNKNNTSGYKGVSFCNTTNKWHSQIKINYKRINLGYYVNIQEAVEARRKAELEL